MKVLPPVSYLFSGIFPRRALADRRFTGLSAARGFHHGLLAVLQHPTEAREPFSEQAGVATDADT